MSRLAAFDRLAQLLRSWKPPFGGNVKFSSMSSARVARACSAGWHSRCSARQKSNQLARGPALEVLLASAVKGVGDLRPTGAGRTRHLA